MLNLPQDFVPDDSRASLASWFTDFWGENVNVSVVDDIASPDMLLKYSLHEPPFD